MVGVAEVCQGFPSSDARFLLCLSSCVFLVGEGRLRYSRVVYRAHVVKKTVDKYYVEWKIFMLIFKNIGLHKLLFLNIIITYKEIGIHLNS